MAKAKDDSKLQLQLKIDDTKDREIYNVLKVTDSKSDFIKDALFHYVYLIEQGKIINRNYPYNKININLDIQYKDDDDDANTKNYNITNNYEQVKQPSSDNESSNKENEEPTNDEGYEEEYEEEDEYEDNFDDVEV